jgi:hypothetical protein
MNTRVKAKMHWISFLSINNLLYLIKIFYVLNINLFIKLTK